MSRPPYRPCLLATEELIEDLAAALRRRDAADVSRHLAAWAAETAEIFDDDPDLDLTAWVHAEVALHVAGGRFEHALCLVERYRRQAPTLADPAAPAAPAGVTA